MICDLQLFRPEILSFIQIQVRKMFSRKLTLKSSIFLLLHCLKGYQKISECVHLKKKSFEFYLPHFKAPQLTVTMLVSVYSMVLSLP